MVLEKRPKAEAIKPEQVGWAEGGNGYGLGGDWFKIKDGHTLLGQGITEEQAWKDAWSRVEIE